MARLGGGGTISPNAPLLDLSLQRLTQIITTCPDKMAQCSCYVQQLSCLWFDLKVFQGEVERVLQHP